MQRHEDLDQSFVSNSVTHRVYIRHIKYQLIIKAFGNFAK